MSSLSDLIEEVRLAEASGKVHFHCGIGTGLASRPAAAQPPVYTRHNAKQVWAAAIEEALPKCRGNRRAAVQMVNRNHPGLRESMVAGANPVQAKSTAQPRAYRNARASLDEMVDALMADGMSRQAATRKAFADNPGLRESMVDSANEQPRRGARR